MRRAGLALVTLVVVVALGAPWLAPNPPDRSFAQSLYAPPTIVHVFDGGPRAPFIYQQRLVSRLERRFEADVSRPVALRWFTGGRLVSVADDEGPLLLLGADALGRDIFARLLYGARASLTLAVVATFAAIAIGALIGGIAGYAGGLIDETLSRLTEFVLVLPTMYVALALRAALPLVLPPGTVFVMLAAIFALLGWPIVARGVRAIVASERERDYVAAGHALGAGPWRMLVRHLLPSTIGYVAVQATLLLPAFILAEATLSYVGLGFPDTVPTWGTMLQDAANVSLIGNAPWMLAPAAAIFIVVLGVNLAVQGRGRAPVQLEL
ncbi:MAG: ABC transporter permease [Acidobacteria bacterium]|nr:ABC transporter permease [Acidobacteriota bacterium]